jgi:hypothetical protein
MNTVGIIGQTRMALPIDPAAANVTNAARVWPQIDTDVFSQESVSICGLNFELLTLSELYGDPTAMHC